MVASCWGGFGGVGLPPLTPLPRGFLLLVGCWERRGGQNNRSMDQLVEGCVCAVGLSITTVCTGCEQKQKQSTPRHHTSRHRIGEPRTPLARLLARFAPPHAHAREPTIEEDANLRIAPPDFCQFFSIDRSEAGLLHGVLAKKRFGSIDSCNVSSRIPTMAMRSHRPSVAGRCWSSRSGAAWSHLQL